MAETGIQFRFDLDPLGEIQPWGKPGEFSLHWFGLTAGRYWIDTPEGQILRYTEAFQKLKGLSFPFVDYQVARLFEDLQGHIPAILEPVPSDLATIASDAIWLSRASDWREQDCDDLEAQNRWSLYQDALGWWHEREIDTSYLAYGPWFSIWRVANNIKFRWTTRVNESDGVPVFTLPSGEFEIAVEGFEAATASFCHELIFAMGKRVSGIQKGGWKRNDCLLDVDALVKEQKQRELRLAAALGRREHTDWQEIRKYMQRLSAQVSGNLT